MDWGDASALADLQMHWDEAYIISLDGEIWSARYRTATDELRAHTSTELRELIRSDYAYRQQTNLANGGLRAARAGTEESDGAATGADDSGAAQTEEPVTSEDAADESEEDGSPAPRLHAERETTASRREEINFAAVRGERMST